MQPHYLILLVVGVLIFIGTVRYYIMHLAKKRRREMLFATPAPKSWDDILKKNVALYRFLPGEKKAELAGHMHIFLDEKSFEGCKGQEIAEAVRVTVAAQACMLLLGQSNPTYYPRLRSILMYPHAYIAQENSGTMQGDSCRLGESWTGGTVVLAWDHTRQTTVDLKDGHNLVMHEFAHQLDQEDGDGDGAPILETTSKYSAWAKVMQQQFAELQDKTDRGRKDVMDSYGATNPAEFFAVATETFFEKGKYLRKKHPELYQQLKDFYKLDPAEWF